jgi:hypothetical protein
LRSVLKQQGWCVLLDACDNFLNVAASLGKPTSSLNRPLIQSLIGRPRDEAPRNSLSGIFGLGEFPPHTDVAHWHTPARYVLLRCTTANDIPTILLDSKDFLTHQQRQLWAQSTWKVTRISFPFLCSMAFVCNGVEGLRWDSCCMTPYGKRAEEARPMIIDTLGTALRTAGQEVRWTSPGMVLVIDNWRMLHARPAIPNKSQQRELRRILVEETVDGGRA